MSVNAQTIAEHLASGHFGTTAVTDQLDTAQDELMDVLGLDELTEYDGNPRQIRNVQYENIKASLLQTGSSHLVLNVTRRPGESLFFPAAGGNTRLQCLRELWEETGNRDKYYWVSCRIIHWPGESRIKVNHLVENDNRGDYCFYDRAKALYSVWQELGNERGQVLSERAFMRVLEEMGYTRLSRSTLHLVRRVCETIADYIPQALQAGLGPRAVADILHEKRELRDFLSATTGNNSTFDEQTLDNAYYEVLASLDGSDLKAVRSTRIPGLVFTALAPVMISLVTTTWPDVRIGTVERGLKAAWLHKKYWPSSRIYTLRTWLHLLKLLPHSLNRECDRTLTDLLEWHYALPRFLQAACPQLDRHLVEEVVEDVLRELDSTQGILFHTLRGRTFSAMGLVMLPLFHQTMPNLLQIDIENALHTVWCQHEDAPKKPIRQISEILWMIAQKRESVQTESREHSVMHPTKHEISGAAISGDLYPDHIQSISSSRINTIDDDGVSGPTSATQYSNQSGLSVPQHQLNQLNEKPLSESEETLLSQSAHKQVIKLAEIHGLSDSVGPLEPMSNGFWIDLPPSSLEDHIAIIWWFLFDLSGVALVPDRLAKLMHNELAGSRLARVYLTADQGSAAKQVKGTYSPTQLALMTDQDRPRAIRDSMLTILDDMVPKTPGLSHLLLHAPNQTISALFETVTAVRSLRACQRALFADG